MSSERIVMTGPISPSAVELLEQIAPVEVAPSMNEDALVTMLEGTIGIVARGLVPISDKIISGCPTLRVIGRTGAGFDSVDD